MIDEAPRAFGALSGGWCCRSSAPGVLVGGTLAFTQAWNESCVTPGALVFITGRAPAHAARRPRQLHHTGDV